MDESGIFMSRVELETSEAALRTRFLEASNEDALAFQNERLNVGEQVEDALRRPIFFAPRLHEAAWQYPKDLEGALMQGLSLDEAPDYTPLSDLTRTLVRMVRKEPSLAGLREAADHMILDCLKEGSHHGIFRLDFVRVDGGRESRILAVAKSAAHNESTRQDAERLRVLESTGLVPRVDGVGALESDSANVVMVMECLPCHEISVHREGDARVFKFLEGDARHSLHVPTGVSHEVMGDRMARTLFTLMFFNEALRVVPQPLRGDLVWIEPDTPDGQGEVKLISTLNAASLLNQPSGKRQFEALGRYMGESSDTVSGGDTMAVFLMLSSVCARWDSESVDRFYREMAEEGPLALDEESRAHVVYPYTVSNLLNGLLDSPLRGEAFQRAFFALYFAIRFMTAEGTKRRTDPVLEKFCDFYDHLHRVWDGASPTGEGSFSVRLRSGLETLRQEFVSGGRNAPS